MNWDAIGAVGEILGAAAVVVSLIYLALQIKTQNKETRLLALHDMSVGFREATEKMASSDMSRIMITANTDYDDLTDDEVLRFVIHMGNLFRAWEEAYIQLQEGRLDERSWQAMLRHYVLILSSPSAQKVWEIRKGYLDSDFVNFVEALELGEYTIR